MATGKIEKIGKWFILGNLSGGGNTTVTLPITNGTYLACTGHNASNATNTIWILRGTANAGAGAWLMGVGNGATSAITVTNLGDGQFKFESSSGSTNIYACYIGS